MEPFICLEVVGVEEGDDCVYACLWIARGGR